MGMRVKIALISAPILGISTGSQVANREAKSDHIHSIASYPGPLFYFARGGPGVRENVMWCHFGQAWVCQSRRLLSP